MAFFGTPVVKPVMNGSILNTPGLPIILLPTQTIPINSTTTNSIELQNKYQKVCQENATLKQQNQQNSQVIDQQKEKIKCLEEQLAKMEGNMNEKIKRLKSDLETANRDLDAKASEVQTILNGLGNLLSDTQLELLIEKKEKVHWNADDMAKVFPIYYFSKKCYLYLKHNMNYPLPSISAVEEWASTNEVVLRIPAYEIMKGLDTVKEESRERPTKKRRRF